MKQAIRSELPEATRIELEGSRYALLVENKWAPPTVICHGNDPVAVSHGNQPVALNADKSPRAPHVFNPSTNQIEWPEGVLHRIDEVKRGG